MTVTGARGQGPGAMILPISCLRASCPKKLLGVQDSEQLGQRLTGDLVSLIYRDDVHVKHADKGRLRDELVTLKSQSAASSAGRCEKRTLDMGPKVEMLVRRLIQAGRGYSLDSDS